MTKKSYKPSMPWLKVVSTKWLYGSIRFDMDSAQRGVWADLLAFANESPLRGVVCASAGVPFPHQWLADTLRVPLELLESTLAIRKADGSISEESGGIRITNWDFYQVEPKATRKGKKQAKEQGGTPTPDLMGEEPPPNMSRAKLDELAEYDAKNLDQIRDELPQWRIDAAEKWLAEHPLEE